MELAISIQQLAFSRPRIPTAVLVLACLLTCASPSTAQPLQIFTPEDGLSMAGVTAIAQDRQGFLWIGTLGGLNRYDGYEFKTFRHDPADSTSIADNYVNPHALIEDKQGFLWIGTVNGLDRYDPATNRFDHFRHDPDDPNSLSDDNVTSILETRAGQLWVGTIHGLNLLDRETGQVRRFLPDSLSPNGLLPGAINALLEDHTGALWIGTRGGLHRLQDPLAADNASSDLKLEQFTTNGTRPIPGDDIFSLHEDRSGNIWVGTWGTGAFVLDADGVVDPTSGGLPASPGDRVIDIYGDPDGSLWFSTWGNGVTKFHPATGAFEPLRHDAQNPQSLSSDQVLETFRDRRGVLWIATWEGLNKLPVYEPFRTLKYRESSPCSVADNRIFGVAWVPDGSLWVGTAYGLDHVSPADDFSACSVTHFGADASDKTSLSDNAVSSLLVDETGHLWVGTYGGGLNRSVRPVTGNGPPAFEHYRTKGTNATLSGEFIYSLHEGNDGTVWVSTVQSGLNRIDPDRSRITHYRHDASDTTSLSFDSVWPVYEDRDGTIWAGTISGGLNKMDPNGAGFRSFVHDPTDPSTISGNRVISITQDDEGSLWVGTMGSGINRLRDPADGQFERFGPDEGFPHENAACLLTDQEGDIWASTTTGLVRIRPSTLEFKSFGRDDGLPSTTFSFGACDMSSDGELAFGSSAGVVAFRPEEIGRDSPPPLVALTGIRVFNTPAALDSSTTRLGRLTLPYDQNFVTFEYAALDFNAPGANAYAYMLEGVNEDWVHVDNRRLADYPNLDPGEYRFRVKASNDDGVWNEEGASLALIITPPFWQTWWFRLLVVILLVAAGWALYRYDVNRRLAVERTRQAIAADLHDTIGSRLGSIALRLDAMDAGVNGAAEDVRPISQSVRSLSAELRDTLWVVDSGSDRLDDLIDRVAQTSRDLLGGHPSDFVFPKAVPSIRLNMALRRNLISILREALHNAIRHAGASLITVAVDVNGDSLTLTVRDDGRGYDTNSSSSGRGLETLRRRTKDSDGKLEIVSSEGAGTTVSVSVSLSRWTEK